MTHAEHWGESETTSLEIIQGSRYPDIDFVQTALELYGPKKQLINKFFAPEAAGINVTDTARQRHAIELVSAELTDEDLANVERDTSARGRAQNYLSQRVTEHGRRITRREAINLEGPTLAVLGELAEQNHPVVQLLDYVKEQIEEDDDEKQFKLKRLAENLALHFAPRKFDKLAHREWQKQS